MTHAAILPDPRDPPIRDDGLCVNCEGVRKLPERKLHRDVAAHDPFCSAECARAWYGVGVPSEKYSLSGRDKDGPRFEQTPSPRYMRESRYTP